MTKPIAKESRSTTLRLDNCQDCKESLTHDFYTPEELLEKNINLGINQRISFCERCKIMYVNSSK